MDDLIRRSDAVRDIEENVLAREEWLTDSRAERHGLMTAIVIVDSIPAVDAAEVVHGEWITDDATGEPMCSVCHSGQPTRCTYSSVIDHTLKSWEIRYCYFCGARMDGSREEERHAAN